MIAVRGRTSREITINLAAHPEGKVLSRINIKHHVMSSPTLNHHGGNGVEKQEDGLENRRKLMVYPKYHVGVEEV